MGLTGKAFFALLCLVAGGTVAGVVWAWPKLSGGGWKTIVGRLGLFGFTQVVVTLTMLVYVNARFEFYASWADLLGTDSRPGRLETVQAASTIKNAGRDEKITEVGGRTDAGRQARLGALQEFRFHGQVTDLPADVFVILPAEYFTEPARKFPVVVVLTGYPGHPYGMINGMRFPQMIRTEVQAGRAQPTIYVLSRPTLNPPRDTECTDVPGGPQTETFFAEDLPAAMAAHYRTAQGRASWGFMGDSTGGYCAAKIAMRHSDRYSAAVSVSGYFRALKDFTTGDLYGGSKAVRNENDLFWRQENRPPPPISLLVASCRVGEKTYPEAMRFLSGVRPPMRADRFILDSGGHNYRTFRRMWPSALAWMSSHLSVT